MYPKSFADPSLMYVKCVLCEMGLECPLRFEKIKIDKAHQVTLLAFIDGTFRSEKVYMFRQVMKQFS